MSTAWNVNKGGPIPSLANVKAANGLVKLQNTTSAVAALTNIKLNKNAVAGLVKLGNNKKQSRKARKTTRKNKKNSHRSRR
jgi:hypothetical protein